ncbi:hypothetical protein Gpo141_00011820 [Globisporangium polare]
MADGSQPGAAPAQLSKEQREQHKATLSNLAFLNRIASISVTGTTYYDEREHLLFDVVMKDHEAQAAALGSKKKIAKEALKIQSTVTYSNMKGISTIYGVHSGVREWSTKVHQSPGLKPVQCTYCSQFNSSAALELWDFKDHNVHDKDARAALTATDVKAVLEKLEVCLNSYLECARNVPDGLRESDCEGYAHIPALVTRLLQNEDYSSRATDLAAVYFCQIM